MYARRGLQIVLTGDMTGSECVSDISDHFTVHENIIIIRV